jgi:hypothetical protein
MVLAGLEPDMIPLSPGGEILQKSDARFQKLSNLGITMAAPSRRLPTGTVLLKIFTGSFVSSHILP